LSKLGILLYLQLNLYIEVFFLSSDRECISTIRSIEEELIIDVSIIYSKGLSCITLRVTLLSEESI
jgi:hypothetical protein